MNPNVSELVMRFRHNGVMIDTNLLLVLIVGNVDPRFVGTMALTEGYSPSDYEMLRDILASFDRFVVIPQILTETGNSLKRNTLEGTSRLRLHSELASFITFTLSKEEFVPSESVVRNAFYPYLGYADAAILEAASDRFMILTDDNPLANEADRIGVGVLRFDWLRI